MLDSIPVGINFVGEECLDDVFLVALFFAGFFLAARIRGCQGIEDCV